MKRRDFLLSLGASIACTLIKSSGQTASGRPRLLVTSTDPFTGIALLKTRYDKGMRPSDDMEGWALSWLLTKDEQFAERAIAAMRSGHVSKGGKPSRSWVDYARWSIVFDWLREFRGFDNELRTRIASELMDGAAAMIATPDFQDARSYSYHNYSLRYLALPAFVSVALDGYSGCSSRCTAWREKITACFANVLETTGFATPEGSYHESMDYMRITWACLTLLAELQRTATGVDPAHHYSVFENIGNTYLYKLLPDGTPSREGDNEYPILDARDTSVMGYAVNRFKDPYAAWLLRSSGFVSKEWTIPVLRFLWNDPEVVPRDPALAPETELPRQRYFPGVGHLVMRDGWKADSTWIEFDCGPYLAKHQHLDQNQVNIYHKGYLAIDSGADYTDSESPHYINYYRRTVAHNTMLIYDPVEQFFWSENVLRVANDGGQRMDSSRYWNTIRSPQDFERTRDIWDLGTMRVIDYSPGKYHYALGDATHAYSREKLKRFTRELMYFPTHNLLVVFDRVVSTNPTFRKVWLLHSVNQPSVDGDDGKGTAETREFADAKGFRIREGQGELLVHALLPRSRTVTRRGGPGNEFWCPGNDQGGAWGTGTDWSLEPVEGGPLPSDPKLVHMWKTFWGEDFSHIAASNRKNVVPGAWRIEVSPSNEAEEHLFLHVLEIGDVGTTGKAHVNLLEGTNFAGAACDRGPGMLFATSDSAPESGEVSVGDISVQSLTVSGLKPNLVYELSFSGPNIAASPKAVPPGVLTGIRRERTNEKGVLRLDERLEGNSRLRIALV